MSSLFKSRLFRQQFSAFACLTVFFLGTMVAGIFLRTKSAIEAREAEIAGVYRDTIIKVFSQWLEERKSDVEYIATTLEAGEIGEVVSQNTSRQARIFMESKRPFSDIFVVGTDGYVLSNRTGPAERKIFLGDRDYFQASREGRPYISEVFRNRLTGRYAFAISRPLRFAGRVQAVVVGTVLISDLAKTVEGLDFQELGSVYIVDTDRRLIAGSMTGLGLSGGSSPEPPVLENLAAREAAARRRGAGKYRDEAGATVVGAYGWFPELSLGAVVELRNSRALVPVTRLLEFSAIFAAGMIVILLILAYAQSARLVLPIQALAEAASTLEAREYAEMDIKKTATELDTLIDAFNGMARAVRDREGALRESAARDSLTGLYNHAKIAEYLEIELRRKKRGDGAVCFVMLDIDHFKDVNDSYGHQAGDAVLRDIAKLLQRLCREGDIVGRYGGEEFAVILNSDGSEETGAYCERIRKAVEAMTFVYDGTPIRITVSLGYACVVSAAMDPYDVIKSADRALYAAKEQGRNRSVAG